jgi:hypothetical protein
MEISTLRKHSSSAKGTRNCCVPYLDSYYPRCHDFINAEAESCRYKAGNKNGSGWSNFARPSFKTGTCSAGSHLSPAYQYHNRLNYGSPTSRHTTTDYRYRRRSLTIVPHRSTRFLEKSPIIWPLLQNGNLENGRNITVKARF